MLLVDFGTPGLPDYFGLRPSPANYIKPGKKPLSSMSPILVFRKDAGNATDSRMGKIVMGIGASGGPKIISAVLQVFLNYAWVGMDLFASMASPRLHDQLLYHESATTLYEKSTLDHGQPIEVSMRTRDALKKRGHRLHSVDYTGCVQSVVVDLETNTLTATSDIRKGGMPNGY
jgi:gamma-glutamyltranspeptidase